MKKWQWAVLAVATVLLLWAMYYREGFDTPTAISAEDRGLDRPQETLPLVCPMGTARDPDNKCRYTEESTMFICPSGYSPTNEPSCMKDGGRRDETVPSRCPEGKILIDRRCERQPVEPGCPTGYTVNNNVCSRNPEQPFSGNSSASSTTAPAFGDEIPVSEGSAAGQEIPTTGEGGGSQPIQCASGETTAFTAPHPTAPRAQICIPAGTDIFDMPADWMEAIREIRGSDPAIIAKAACKRDGYSLLMLLADLDPTKPMPLPKCVAMTPYPMSNGGGSGSPFTSGNTTGGSSSTSAGPNSGGGGNRRKQIFGPLFTEIGDGGNFSKGEDSSKTNQYPELLGGGEVRKSTLVPGVGVVDPSKNSDTSGLPTPGGLGSNEDSKFLPTSRVPGDMEKIPDPWRVSQSFSASNYSFKTDPVPFLTNFSAFQK